MSSSKDVFVSAPNGWRKKMNAGEITIFARPIPGLVSHTSADAQ